MLKMKGNLPIVVVSGAGGFLGRELVKQLLERGSFSVIAMSSKKELVAEEFCSHPNLLTVDINNWKQEVGKNLNLDVLINCAFPRTSEPEQLAKGLLFTENLIKDSIELNVKKIINISSQSVYSQKEKMSTDENAPVIPESFYGMTKYASERIIAAMCENSANNITYSNIRLASLTGLSFEIRMTNRFVKQALQGQPIVINGGRQRISYLDVRDAAAALIAMIKADVSGWKKVYNLGNYYSCTLLELAETVKDIAKKFSVSEVNLQVRDGDDNFNNLVNSALFYSDFNWKPEYTIPMMVNELFEHYKERNN
ncbi:NAD-dependent epimerase/dehydratase family protein [Halalkalibacterium halodurans]|uniref:NAD-dependent epimerase/dehydratase domain-containing protein n=1 Tax=Halalkalibacterium halodurans TaxID=86665 RepID=A0A0M0KFR1_ALKHA|nr:NAD(P)-dependent oxidoreductase [Halalkalibacterium halodurans]TPE68979.1 NAD(P)-dependent oxidoreductase [Halalkalibacterium halodurans]